MQPLDPFTIPLTGVRLIEASAGTGKTYTLTLLYLRLIVQKGLPVDKILVVTFTRAATDELRTRIRSRLKDSLRFLTAPSAANAEYEQIFQTIDPDVARQRVHNALIQMDEAAIFTIHSFCQRVLQDNAFETGVPFAPDFLESEASLRREIIEDFWRQKFYTSSPELAAWVIEQWETPDRLLGVLKQSLNLHGAAAEPQLPPDALAQVTRETGEQWKLVQERWLNERETICDILLEDPCLKRSAKTYRRDKVEELILAMDRLCSSQTFPYHLPTSQLKFLQQSLLNENILKKCAAAPQHPFFSAFENFYELLARCTHLLKITILQQARRYLLDELKKRKISQSKLYFDDLLTSLAGALQGSDGDRLAHQLSQAYPAALVDEFQDTDPLQYTIFRTIYPSSEDTTLFMIGDPKQAIYSFRGADIFAYIGARRQTPAQNCYTMATNYRSSVSMVNVVNVLFNRPNSFLFEPDIVFHPVTAAPTAEDNPFTINGQPAAPLQALVLAGKELYATNKATIAKDKAAATAALFCADQIYDLLAGARAGKVKLGKKELTAGDIAVLVRTHKEANQIRQHLSKRGITSVYYSRESVFSTLEAHQLYQVLDCLLGLPDTHGVSTALTTALFGYSASKIGLLRSNPEQWEALLVRLHNYRRLWQEQGVISLLYHIISAEQVVRRLTGQHGGERKLTNLVHLAELLQQSPAASHGGAGLLRWYQDQLENPDQESEAQQLRLENDEKLVKIVTIHKSKGLEYPIVFLPYLWASGPQNNPPPFSFHNPETLHPCIDFGSGIEAHQTAATREQQAENMRLLYVALTRARYCCYFCWGAVSGVEQSGLAWLLHPELRQADVNEQRILQELDQFTKTHSCMDLTICPPIFGSQVLAEPVTQEQLTAREFHGQVASGWQMTSYSQLTATDTPYQEGGRSPSAATLKEISGQTVFSFPRGAVPGTCLHNILEDIDFTGPAHTWEEPITTRLAAAGIDQNWQALVTTWLEAILSVQLPGSCALQEIDPQKRINELSFLFSLDQVDMEKLNQVLSRWEIPPIDVPQQQLNGMMKGFIDLVFVHRDRFFIADYKSNFLGATPQDYSPKNLRSAMTAHRYDLQYLIYTVALHRYLKHRMNDYRFGSHFGGIYYLFLRGMAPESAPQNGIFYHLPEKEFIEQLDSCFRGGQS